MNFETTVTKIVTGFSNSALRIPYVYGELACGHSLSVEDPRKDAECSRCRKFYLRRGHPGMNASERQIDANDRAHDACPDCGCRASYNRAHDPASLYAIGDAVDCEDCARRHARDLELIETLRTTDETISHTRASDRRGYPTTIYRRDHSSPTGVISFGAYDPTSPLAGEIEQVIRERWGRGAASPLSPTEGR